MQRGALLSVMGLVGLMVGCHGRSGDGSLLEKVGIGRSANLAAKPGELAERARAEIRDECAKQSYETAKKGLLISEVGLHEDVFLLRDRQTYGGLGFGLDEALRLESLLETDAKGGKYPADQAACIEKFATHFESLSDPLVEADARQKELDASAFSKAEQEAEKKLQDAEKQKDGVTPPPNQKDNY